MNDKADYRRDEGVLKFLHNESSKTITIGINKECKVRCDLNRLDG